jgi:hypothetical protein
MLGILFKTKISETQLANAIINSIGESVSNGFEDVALFINTSRFFVASPNIKKEDDNMFFLIVVAANIVTMRDNLPSTHSANVERMMYDNLAKVYGVEVSKIRKVVLEYISFMNRVNMPSKNFLNSLSKTMFFKYNLNEFQDAYFKKMNCGNPIFLKQLSDIMYNFIWNWESFEKKYKLTV